MVLVIYNEVGVEGVAYGEACTSTGDCTETTNIVCDTICKCSPGTFRKTTAAECATKVAALDDTCDATDSASDQCAVADAECRIDGTAKCLCKATHYVDAAACTLRKNPDATCGGDECVLHASCVATKCVCDAGYTPSPTTTPTMCKSSGVVKVTILPCMYVVPILASMMFLLR
ncbi:unnamed protein product [Mytilus coruscus]|uniref:EB domain-containing protein n=1 Tax=Mytilus coruscus TaxID=42192 RepID=A0A6J8BMQ2_MYTCO|nr:unnamed protein product [Mytilus coruscus]